MRQTDQRDVVGRSSAAFLLVMVAAILAACSPSTDLATYRVERRDFVHRVTAEGILRARDATVVSVPSEVRRMARIVWLAEEGSIVEPGDVVARFDPTEIEQRLAEGRADLESSSFKIDRALTDGEVRLSETDKKRKAATLDLDFAQRYQKEDELIYSRAEIIESEIDEDLASDRKSHAEEVHPVQVAQSEAEVALLEVDRRKATDTVEQARQGLEALEVRAPKGGILTWTRDWQGDMPQIGDQVWRGQQLGEIPDLATMEAEVFVLEADAGGLEPGKPAELVVEAHPETSYIAHIERVESVAKRRHRGSPVQYFAAVLALDQTDLSIMKPGQRVRASIEIERRADTLVVPRQAVFLHQEQPHVRVVDEDRPELRPVAVGPQSLGLAVIEEGLEAGELVVLTPPEEGPDREAPAEEPPADGPALGPLGTGGSRG